MSIAMIQAFKKTGLKPTERLVAYMLADHYNDETGRCHPSIRLLADETGLTPRSVITALQKLDESGFITKKEAPNGSNRHYILHPEKGNKPVKEVHRCNTFTGEGGSPLPVKEVHRGGEGGSPLPVKEVHPNRKEPEKNQNINRNDDDFQLNENEPIVEKAKSKPSSRQELLRYAESQDIPDEHAEIFWDMMEAGGWMRGKVKVKDWKAHFRTYHRLGYIRPREEPQNYSSQPKQRPLFS